MPNYSGRKQLEPNSWFKGMLHPIYKLYVKAVFMCIKFNRAINFTEKHFFKRKACFKLKKNKREIQKLVPDDLKLVPDDPKNGA